MIVVDVASTSRENKSDYYYYYYYVSLSLITKKTHCAI